MQQAAGENHRAAWWRLESAWAEFRKGNLAAFEFGIQIDGNRKAPMRRAFRSVVPMGTKMAAIFCRVTAYDVAFHARDVKLMDPGNVRHDAPPDPRLGGANDIVIRDGVILAPLVVMVKDANGSAIDFAHEAGFPAAMRFIEADEFLA